MSQASHEVVVFPDPSIPIKTYATYYPCDVAEHEHDEVELLYLLNGTATVFFGDESVSMAPGDIIVLNARVPHATRCGGAGYAMILMQFHPDILIQGTSAPETKYVAPLLNPSRFRYRLVRRSEGSEYVEIASLMTNCVEEYQLKRVGYELFIKSNLFRILALLYRMRQLTIDEQREPKRVLTGKTDVNRILAFVEKHYGEPLDVAQMSRMLSVNPDYFCRLFKAATGESFVQHLNGVRIAVAERLLLTTNRQITDILAETGFSSLSYFNRIFKKARHCSPSEYRRRMRMPGTAPIGEEEEEPVCDGFQEISPHTRAIDPRIVLQNGSF